MNKSSSRWWALAVMFAGLGAVSSAQATWSFASSGVNDANNDALAKTFYNPDAGFVGDPNLTISGVYAANGASNVGFAAGATWLSNSASRLTGYGPAVPTVGTFGLGMSSDGFAAPNHAIDNAGNTEAVLLNFSSSVVLTSIGVTYFSPDSDVSLFRYRFAGAASLPGTGASLASMVSAGWELVSNYADLAVDTGSPYNVVNGGNLGSSWWLISAYNSSYGASYSVGNDALKISAVAGSKCMGTAANCGQLTRVPEPSSLALMGAALLGALTIRRRRDEDGVLSKH